MKLKWGIVVVVLCLFVSAVSAADKFEDTVQYHTLLSESWSGDGTIAQYPGGYPYSKSIYLGSGASAEKCVKSDIAVQTDYWSFYVRYFSGNGDVYLCAYMYNSDGVLIPSGFYNYYSPMCNDGYPLILDNVWISIWHFSRSGFIEFLREGDHMYLRVDGVDSGNIGNCGETPAYMQLCSRPEYSGPLQTYFDSITTGDGIVGIGHDASPSHSITEVANHELDVEWTLKTIPFSEYTSSQYDMKVKRATWDEWYNTTTLKEAGNSTVLPHGFVKYNMSILFQADHFGLYWFETYKTLSGEPELIDQDWVYYKDVGEPSTINIEDTEYAIGETMNISYYIDSPDFGANQYKIQIFDATGQLKDTRVLTQQAATEQITSTIDWEEGLLYAVLVKDTKPAITEDPPEDIIDLAYDFCTLSNVIYITGKVYDASNADNLVDGTLLDNVSLNWTQAGTIYNTTSDINGNYEFTDPTTFLEIEWFQDVPINVHAEKTGYTHSDFDMAIIKAGRYTVDIYMTPPYDYENVSISGVVADDIFHQAIPQSEVHIWNATWSNATYTNTWGWYEFNNLTNGTYNMYAKKETYKQSSTIQVSAWNMSLTLDSCDTLDYIESTLDKCDATTSWNSDNTLTLNTTDYVEGTGSLQSVGSNTMDFNKTFSAFDSNVTKDGHFYFYSKIDNVTNISSVNVSVTLSSNATGATDTLVWGINKTLFNNTWNLTFLGLSQAVETGTCDLSAIRFFKLESTKSASVTTKIDFLAFIEYVDWNSNVNLSLDTSDKQEGAASILISGKAWIPGSYDHYFIIPPGGGVPPPPDVPVPEYWIDRYWSAPPSASAFSSTNELGRLQIWYKPHYTTDHDIILASGDTSNYLYWQDVGSAGWTHEQLFFKDAYENGTMDFGGIKWFVLLGNRSGSADVEDRIDNIELVQAGGTRQNFFLSQYYDLTVHAKDMDTRFTITDFTAILDSTNVKETTTGTIIYTNITYAIYPLEVSSAGYYTNKQYVFMGQDTEQTVYLTKIENVTGGGAGTYYPPRAVEFKVQTLWGNAVDDVTVSVTALETSGSSWDWLWSIMGLSQDVSGEIQNGSMNGTTDSLGRISFMMVETVKYRVQFTKSSESVNTTITVYPKDSHYVIIVGTKGFTRDTEWYEAVNFTVTWSEINNTHGYINLYYDDISNETLSLLLYINNSDGSLVWNQSYGSGCNQTNAQIEVNKTGGKAFYVGFSADHITFGHSPLDWEQVLKFKWFLDVGIPLEACKYASIAFLVLFACFFGATTVEMGSVFVSMFAWVFHFIGWLEVRDAPTTYLVLTIITTIAVLAYIAARSRRVYRN